MGFGITYFGDSKNIKEKQSFYNYIDYLLNSAIEEGGPLSVVEAFSAGVPIISPPIGYAFDLGVDYFYIDTKDLVDVLATLLSDKYKRFEKVKDRTWKAYSEKCIKFSEKMLYIKKNP